MAEITFKFKGRLHDESGKFVSQVDGGLAAAMEEMAADGEILSTMRAPKGKKPDPRTVTIREGMFHRSTQNSATWGSTARHAGYQETGGRPHPITGRVSFYWERKERWWRPGDNWINHPGNPATHYLRDALDQILGEWPEYARVHLGKVTGASYSAKGYRG